MSLSTSPTSQNAPRQTSTLATLSPLTAAAVSTAFMMYPVDVLRALTMASAGSSTPFSITAFYKKFGLQGFVSKGVVPEIVKSSVMRVSKFFFFPILCEQMYGSRPTQTAAWKKGLAGGLATVPEIVMISPLEVAKIGMQLDTENKYKNNSRAFLSHLYRTKGLSGWYSGWAGMQWRQFAWTGTYFATLSFWKSQIETPLSAVGAPKAVVSFLSGFVAGTFAVIPNAPGDVVRSVVQKRMFQDPTSKAYGISPAGVMEHVRVAMDIVNVDGARGLFKGFGFKALHLGGSGALMAMFIPIFSSMMGIGYGGV